MGLYKRIIVYLTCGMHCTRTMTITKAAWFFTPCTCPSSSGAPPDIPRQEDPEEQNQLSYSRTRALKKSLPHSATLLKVSSEVSREMWLPGKCNFPGNARPNSGPKAAMTKRQQKTNEKDRNVISITGSTSTHFFHSSIQRFQKRVPKREHGCLAKFFCYIVNTQ